MELVRRILYAFGGDGNLAVTKSEAEALFAINDALMATGEESTPAWSDLFTKAIANVVMSGSGYKMPTREEALRHESWLEERGELSPASFFSQMVAGGLVAVINAYREQSSEERAMARLERQRLEIITGESVGEDEARWLAARIGNDGRITPPEQALLDFFAAENVKVHPAFGELIGRFSKAA